MHFFIWKLIQTFSLYLSICATFHTIPNSWDCLQAIKYEMVHKMSVKIQNSTKILDGLKTVTFCQDTDSKSLKYSFNNRGVIKQDEKFI